MPKSKKNESTTDSDSGPCDSDDKNPSPAKKSKNNVASKQVKKSATQWTLEKLRQVRINEFRGRKMVDIREFYEKNGELLPGKKGISLSIEQWKKLLELSKEVNEALDV